MEEAKVFANQFFDQRKCAFNVNDFTKAIGEQNDKSEKNKSLSPNTKLRVLQNKIQA
jgi:hypothetical protein